MTHIGSLRLLLMVMLVGVAASVATNADAVMSHTERGAGSKRLVNLLYPQRGEGIPASGAAVMVQIAPTTSSSASECSELMGG